MFPRLWLSSQRGRRAVAGLGAAALVIAASPTFAFDAAQNQLVSANPADNTPDVTSTGSVRNLAQTGNTVVAGGNFTQVKNHGGTTTYNRHNLFSFDAATGALNPSFAPNLDGLVQALVISPDGADVIAGGEFHHVNGTTSIALVEVRLSDGSIVPTFKVPTLDGSIFTMKLVGARLLIGGYFTHVGGKAIDHLAALNATTGAVDPTFTAHFTGVNNPNNRGSTVVYKMDVSPNGQRLVTIGNFMQVNGSSRPQIAMFDLTKSSPALVNWATNRYSRPCSNSYQTYLRDVDFSPNGAYFVVVTTGGSYNGDQTVGCDNASRWETGATGSGLQPTWTDFTGNDALTSVAVTGTAVYTGGHNRWMNNAYGSDSAGPGAVARPGLSALDPLTGVPFDWSPARTLGTGVYDLLATSAGLWIGDDTDYVGHEYHYKLAFFPLTGGEAIPAANTGGLPGSVYQLSAGTPSLESVGTCGSTTSPSRADTVSKRQLNPAAHPVTSAATSVVTQGVGWSQVTASVMVSNTVYTAWRNGDFCAATFNGSTFSAPQPVNLYGNKFGGELSSLGGMFFTGDRIYYTRVGGNGLFYRYFVPESAIVGAVEYTATNNLVDLNFSRVGGMVLNGNKLYYVTRNDGILHQINWNGTMPVVGTALPVSGPLIDGVNWTAPGLFLYAG
jgi:hypothetical protein